MMRNLSAVVLVSLLVCSPFVPALVAQAPDYVSFQGYLTNAGGTPINSTESMTFKLYRDGTAVWTETQPSVAVANGVFNVRLGTVTPLDTMAFDDAFELGVKVGVDPEITPRTPLSNAAYAKALPGLYTFYQDEGNRKSYNVIGGASNNAVASNVTGGTIGGGGGYELGEAPNVVTGDWGTIGGGSNNTAAGSKPTIAGGTSNSTQGIAPFIGGGALNSTGGDYGTVGGGSRNTAAHYGVVGGGFQNSASGHAFIGSGLGNRATGTYSAVPGGYHSHARADYAFAAGYKARAVHYGSFVWNDNSVGAGNDSLKTTAPNQFLIRAAGGVGIGTATPSNQLSVNGGADISGNLGIGTDTPPAKLSVVSGNDDQTGPMLSFFGTASDQVESGRIRFIEGNGQSNFRGGYVHYDGNANLLHIGVHNTNSVDAANDQNVITIPRGDGRVGIKNTAPGHPLVVGTDGTNGHGAHVTIGGVWTNGSSREFKQGFEELDKAEVLEKLALLPITKWQYKASEEVAHIGPMAEDFREAFGLGHDDRYIGTVDADGVAFAAIQALYELVLAQQERIAALEARE